MVNEGLLDESDVDPDPSFPKEKVDYEAVIAYKKKLFNLAYERFKEKRNNYEYEKFCSENSHWLDDYALFASLRFHFHGQVWNEWPREIRDRDPEALV